MRHQNITNLQDVVIPDNNLDTFDEIYFVMDHCHTDLRKIINSCIELDVAHIKLILWNILCGLKELHGRMVVHRDLKPANILVNKDCSVKICDLGFARSLQGMYEES